jgi:uncharacterized protein YecE (DUF72 family)
MHDNIHIGTSGWSYKHWKGIYYPEKLAASRWLTYYAHDFSTTEINGCFYRLPSEETVLKWAEQVPDNFLFAPKMSRYLTHMKKLRDPEEPLERFFSVFEPMRVKMGPVLVQLPPQLGFHYELAEGFYAVLKERYPAFTFVVEVRHPSWLQEKSMTLLAKYALGFVISHSEKDFPYLETITAPTIYVRFHGPRELYASSYSDAFLQSFALKFRNWVDEGHIVWAYFNNDIHGHAVNDARRLIDLLNK